MTKLLLSLCCTFACLVINAQDLEPIELSEAWLEKVEDLAPETPSVPVDGRRKILIFSLHTGYEHWVLPHTEAVFQLLLAKSGAAVCTSSKDIGVFETGTIENYDAIVLNNTCSERDKRDIFYDVLRKNDALTEEQRLEKAAELEANLLRFVKQGGGLVLVHGGATIQNNSEAFSEMSGGSFDFHPKQQPIKMKLAEPDHPLLRAFKGKGFIHTDEPYFYKNSYADKNFRPLLYMQASELQGVDKTFEENKRYVAWIKKYGDGRVFLTSTSHNAQSFENPQLLQFLLDGMQYALGDLECDDTPIGKN
jgi:type 1 glutamine amidotransferase